jgi:hypothetical protein
LFYRQVSHLSTGIPDAALSSFGFLPNGIANDTFSLDSPETRSSHILVHLYTRSEFIDFELNPYLDTDNCSDPRFNSGWNFSLILTSQSSPLPPQIASSKAVIIPVILHCSYSSGPPASYSVTQLYDNIESRLDYRELPNLTMLPILIGVWGAALVGWTAFAMHKKRRPELIHICVTSLGIIFLITLILTFAWYKHADKSDSGTTAMVFCIIFEALFWTLLFIFLIVASSGWGVIVSNLTRSKLVKTVAGSIGLTAAVYIVRYVYLGLWILLVLVVVAAAGYFVALEVLDNTGYAQTEVKAHLLVIFRDGIDPTTTPVYEKYRTYGRFVSFAAGTAIALAAVVVFMMFADVPHWIELLVFYLFTIALLAVVGYLYRPRGEAVDRYFRVDDDDEGDRQAIQLDDLNDFDVSGSQGQGKLRPWDGEALPPRPVLVRPGVVSNVPVAAELGQEYMTPLRGDEAYA